MQQQKPEPPEPSCVSIKSNCSVEEPLDFKGGAPADGGIHQNTPDGPQPICVSMKSDHSMGKIAQFKDEQRYPNQRMQQQKPEPPEPSCVSIKSNRSVNEPFNFKDGAPVDGGDEEHSSDVLRGPCSQMDSTFMLLEENLISFIKKELKRLYKIVNQDYPGCIEDEEVLAGEEEEEEQRRSSKEAFLKITLHFLRRMKQEDLAERLRGRTTLPECQCKLKRDLQKKFRCVFEGISKPESPTLLKEIYTELYITEGGDAGVNEEHEVIQIEKASRRAARPQTIITPQDIFKAPTGRYAAIRTVLTKGVAGIGKTVLTQKLTLDWAEDNAKQDMDFIFPFTFRELNLLKDKKFSLVGLVHHFFPQTKEAGICSLEDFQVVFIFDGLDECRLPLDFHHIETPMDVTESTSVDVVLTNLIRGNLLPSARLWITTRPAAANRLPPECVSMVTEVRGFSDSQKEKYFRKRFTDEQQATSIISHIRSSRSLHIMCHIPVFCRISATVLEDMLKSREGGELPKSLTEMYIHFLLVQTKLKKVKYDGEAETGPLWNRENKKMIRSLGKLAFEQLQKGQLIFYESDLTECDLDVRAASVCSGVFTQIFREERGLYQDKVFCFVHLSLQEFLAALHVHLTYLNSYINLLAGEQTIKRSKVSKKKTKHRHWMNVYQGAVDKALKSPHGHLDLFLRFLMGLSLQTNQTLLRGLVTETESSSKTNQKTAKFIKEKISKHGVFPERAINLFHCLNELNDGSLVKEIQLYFRSETLSRHKLSPAEWSALGFILLSSKEVLEVFDLKKYFASEEVFLRLLPVVKASNKALLSGCQLSARSCEALSSVLSSPSSSLTQLDLSNNDLQDSGVKLLCAGLRSPHCHLETLNLSGCLITEEGCASLASALSSNPSHLRELDLSYNHPGDSGVQLLSPLCTLDTLRVDHGGERRLRCGLRKYCCPLQVDTHTVNTLLQLSDHNRKVTRVEEKQPYPEHPDRFDQRPQLLCATGLTGRCYWEVEWRGGVDISVSYREINRKGHCADGVFGKNTRSWSLICSDDKMDEVDDDHCRNWVCHNNRYVQIPDVCQRAAVYVDCEAGTVSFYSVASSHTLTHIHTFYTNFTQTLYPAFRLWRVGSSVTV